MLFGQGIWGNVLTLINVILAALLATTMFEPLADWLESQMPPTYRDGLVFINDSQGFKSLSAMVTDFAAWGQYFAPAPVGFQYGYPRDRRWWSRLSDPPGDIGHAILNAVPNTSDLYWVDFSAYDIWPPE